MSVFLLIIVDREQFNLTTPIANIIYMIEWMPRVCIETQNQTNTEFIGTRRKRIAVSVCINKCIW